MMPLRAEGLTHRDDEMVWREFGAFIRMLSHIPYAGMYKLQFPAGRPGLRTSGHSGLTDRTYYTPEGPAHAELRVHDFPLPAQALSAPGS